MFSENVEIISYYNTNLSCTLHPPSTVFDVQPAFGTLCGQTEITVTYRPTEFVTSGTNMQIVFSTFDRKTLKCKINGNCLPGLLTLQKKKEFALRRKQSQTKMKSREPSLALSQLPQARKKKAIRASVEDSRTIKLGQHHHINKVLNNKNSNNSSGNNHAYANKSKKFRDKLKLAVEVEKANQLKWQKRKGENLPSEHLLEQILSERSEQAQTSTQSRTERFAGTVPTARPNFDPYRNSPWRARHVAMGKFQQAARTVLIRVRGDARLAKLRKLIKVPVEKTAFE